MIERLKNEMDRLGINARELSLRANVGRSFVYDILSGKSSNPTTKKITAIADVLGVNVSYLIYGEKSGQEYSNGNFVSIPAIEVVSGKNNKKIVDINKKNSHFCQGSWITNSLRALPQNLRFSQVQCDNMQPSLYIDDNVLIDISTNSPGRPGIFAIFDGNNISFNRLSHTPNHKVSNILVSSDNLKYNSYEVNALELYIIGRVVWFARQL